jgi:putative flippase GtrA
MNLRTFLSKLIIEKPKARYVRYFRYLTASVLCTALDFLVLYILTDFAKIHYLISAAIGYIFGMVSNYFLSIHWIFHKRKIENKTVEFNIFLVTAIIPLIIAEIGLWFFVDIVGIHYLISKAIIVAAMFAVKYVIRKKYLF